MPSTDRGRRRAADRQLAPIALEPSPEHGR